MQDAARLQSQQQWATDPLFENTTLLLQADNAPNAAQNNTFIDSSANAFTITRNGNTTQGTFTPFSATGWSNFFDGSGDYLYTNSNVSIGTSVFTIELWVYVPDGTADKVIFSLNGGTTDRFTLGVLSSTLVFRYNGVSDVSSGQSLPSNQWNHVAVVREGTGSNQTKLYLNGVSVGTGTVSTNYATDAINIGTGRTRGSNDFSGYISNARLVIGTALYTSNFTPSTTPLTAVSGASLLTCQSNRFVDNSTSAYTFTVTGTPSVQAFAPFAPQFQYTPTVIGGSGYGGSGVGYLLAPASSNFQYPGDFSVEMWVYTTTSNTGPIWGTASAGQGDQIYLNGASSIFYDLTSFTYFNSASSVVQYAWSHICITRQSTTLRVFINGILIGTKTQAATLGSATVAPGIFIRGGLDDQIAGPMYMTDLRVCKGSVPTSYQTSSTTLGATIFTPPTQAVTTTSQGATASNVSLLCNFTNAAITDGTMKNNLQTVGNAQVSTSVVKYGAGSMAFDGTGDYLTSNAATTNLYAFGTGDFTIEFWIYSNSFASSATVFDPRPNGDDGLTTPYPQAYWDTSGRFGYYTTTATRILSSPLNTNTWYHIAISRSGANTRMFVNGVQAGSTYTDSNNYTCGVNRPLIGGSGFSPGSFSFNGYIDDLRITKGIARYTANFTPPQVALPRQ